MGRFVVLVLVVGVCVAGCKNDQQEVAPIDVKREVSTKKSKLLAADNAKTKDAATLNESESSSAPSEMLQQHVKINQINYSILKSRLLAKINEERRRLGLQEFGSHIKLANASAIHNRYMVRNDVLDHTQVGTSTPDMVSRVKKAGGDFRTMGENIQYEGFTIRTTNGVESIIAPTYEELATNLWLNWKNSPPHYKNIINPEFKVLGTALDWSDKKSAIFATQVYAG